MKAVHGGRRIMAKEKIKELLFSTERKGVEQASRADGRNRIF